MPAPDHLSNAARKRSAAKRAAAIAAIRELDRLRARITVAAVAKRAGVSREFIYSHPDLRQEIEELRARHSANGAAQVPYAERATEASLRERNSQLRARNQTLAEDNKYLRRHLALALGALMEHDITPPRLAELEIAP